jgi:general secretion pathway protein D
MNLARELVDRESRVTLVPGTDPGAARGERERRRHGLVFVAAMPATNTLLLRSTDQKALAQIREVVRDLDKPTPQVLLEVKVLNLELEDGQERGIDWLFSTGDGENSGGFTSGTIQGTVDPGNPAAPLSLRGTGFDVNSVVFNHITDTVNARIRLLQKEGRLTTLATPTLLVADNEASRVFIGTQRQYVEDVEAGKNIGTPEEPIFSEPTPKLATQNVGNTLVITPKIHADRTVTIRLLQEDSQLGAVRPVSYGGLSFDLEDVQQSSIVTTVVARDGNLLAIGGLISEETGETVKGIPGLMHIPLLGNLFKHKTATRKRNELIVLIRPIVLLAPGEEDTATRGLMRRLSRHPAASGGDVSELGAGTQGDAESQPATSSGSGGSEQ